MSDLGVKHPLTLKISEMPAEERPREKLLARGPAALIDPELIAILLGSGLPGANLSSPCFSGRAVERRTQRQGLVARFC